MLFGLTALVSDRSVGPAELAREAEARGFESIWFADHSHIPVKRESPWAGGPTLPDAYLSMMDPLVAMAAAASVTTRIRLGTGVALVVERDPIHLAKSLASIDLISGGRVEFGIGGGWNLEEMRNHGTDPTTRWELLRERVEAIKAIWTTEPAEYHGKLVSFDPIFCRPKPVQRPHPRIHVGGAAPAGYRRALRYGDGWIPMLGRGNDNFAEIMPALREEALKMGRSLDGFQVSVYAGKPDRAVLESYRAAGIHRVAFSLPTADRSSAVAAMDQLAELAQSLS